MGLQITQLVLSCVVSAAPETYTKGFFTLLISLRGRNYGKVVGCFFLFLSLSPEDVLVTVVAKNRS